ncbi:MULTISPECIES: MarR family winged helix-turn-helix transcriptional regulator [Brevibacterium]|jgi:DNA-binding MarR family transcriptional regulator|uniref:HTH marR-type domain-containing protein n=1 Tax=Brevibacterium salitolerans TaxID=1403566 RepID=A0ABP5IJL9_9MICO|nr:MarR family transcriptional regulator [Brevibacterium sp.]
MLPEPLKDLLPQASTDPSQPASHRAKVYDLIHTNLTQAMASRTFTAQFAHTHGLNLIDFHVLQVVVFVDDEEGTATPGYIARQLSLSASTLTSILERLVRADYLLRERDSADRRRISIYATDKTMELLASFYSHIADEYESLFPAQGDEQLAGYTELLSTLTEANGAVALAFERNGENLRSATQGRALQAEQSGSAGSTSGSVAS